ncbi:aminotransferase class V-fold PLP-dependent enzyme [Actinoplanes sp. TFC3]|uniref:aminotransferase class V-fold PLP-dependent enzyme n=1 Tax=Actinoplanes sp. TFC3 TaxID=1710355 RepID=UPI00082F89C6|nr:cysteine desulfurase [Actinoplanes sp. TFC3]
MSSTIQQERRGGPPLSATVRDDFPFFAADAPGAGLAYLDNAATTQKPAAVLNALTDYYTHANSNVGRGYYQLSMTSTERFEAARETVRTAIQAGPQDDIIFTAGTTHAVNLLAATIGRKLVGKGDRLVVTGMEHNSNLLPWRRLCEESGARLVVVPVQNDGTVAAADFAAALGPDVPLVAIAHVSNVLGTVNPVRAMVAAAHSHGAYAVVDGAQAVPHGRTDVSYLGSDFYCFSAHKMYGPMGTGVLHARSGLLTSEPPYQVGGGTVKAVSSRKPVHYVGGPARWEAGTPNVAGAVGLAAAFDYLGALGWDAVRAHDEALVRAATEALADIPAARIIGDPAAQPSGLVSFVMTGIHPYDVGGHLDKQGIAVRCGVHCASTFLDDLGLLGTVRLSFGVYNTVEEITRVHDALRTVRPGYWTSEQPTTRFV